jgi:hypothetical protein
MMLDKNIDDKKIRPASHLPAKSPPIPRHRAAIRRSEFSLPLKCIPRGPRASAARKLTGLCHPPTPSNLIEYNPRTQFVTFIQCPRFDRAPEPAIEAVTTVRTDGAV